MTDIVLTRGEYRVIRVTLTQGGVAVDLNNALVSLVVRDGYPADTIIDDTDAILNKVVGGWIVLTTPSSGIFDVTFNSSDTFSIEILGGATRRDYVYGIKTTLAGDPGPRPVAQGVFSVTSDIVRAM